MALAKRIANSLTLGVDYTGSTSFTILATIRKMISGPNVKAEAIKLDLLGDVWDTKARGSLDPGEYKFAIVYDPGLAEVKALVESMADDFVDIATLPNWQITYAAVGAEAAVSETFFGFVSGFEKTGEKNNLVEADITITVSGNPGLKQA